MSVLIPINILNDEYITYLKKKLILKVKKRNLFEQDKIIKTFKIIKNKDKNDDLLIPLNFYITMLQNKNDIFKKFPNDNKFFKFDYEFRGNLRQNQIELKNEILPKLKQERTCNINPYCNFGKTILAIYLACCAKLKTAIVVHRSNLFQSWEKTILNSTNTFSQKVIGTSELNTSCDFYLVNNTVAMNKSDDFWNTIGFLIIDEADSCSCGKKFSKIYTKFQPKYAIGLTATFNRDDGMEKLLKLYLGKENIVRIDNRPFDVYKYNTQIQLEYKYNNQGKVDYHAFTYDLSTNKEINNIIASVINMLNNDNINMLALCKLKIQCELIREILIDNNISSDDIIMYIGKSLMYDTNKKIVLSTFDKSGIGFNDITRKALLNCFTCKKIEQFKGRVGRELNDIPLVYDFVDKNSISQNHWNIRQTWYKSRNCNKIINFTKYYKDFKLFKYTPQINKNENEIIN